MGSSSQKSARPQEAEAGVRGGGHARRVDTPQAAACAGSRPSSMKRCKMWLFDVDTWETRR